LRVPTFRWPRRQTVRPAEELQAYEIRVDYDIDAGGGSIRSRADNYSVGLELGPMVGQTVPNRRPPGFRWFKVERVGNTTLRYGYNVRKEQLQATVVNAPVAYLVNLASRPNDTARFIWIARTLAKTRCSQVTTR
jgi:hypothetical protein